MIHNSNYIFSHPIHVELSKCKLEVFFFINQTKFQMDLKSILAGCGVGAIIVGTIGAGYTDYEPKGRFEYHPTQTITENGAVIAPAEGILLDTQTGKIIRINAMTAAWQSMNGWSMGEMVTPRVGNGDPNLMVREGRLKNGAVLNPGIDPGIE